MKIGNPLDLIRTGNPASGTSAAEADKVKASTLSSSSSVSAPAKPDSSSTVKLSGGLASLKSELVDSDAFDTKRVEELKALMAQGNFKVNAEVVADKLISGNLDALSRAKT